MNKKDITIVLVSFFSFSHLKRIANELKNHKIIIVENSRDIRVIKYFKNKKNINIIFPKKNLGYGAGNNLAIKKSETLYNLILNPDTNFKRSDIKKLKEYALKLRNFGIIFPRINQKIPSNPFDNNLKKVQNVNYKFVGYGYIAGCAMLINKEKFQNGKIFDERFFLYKEETDLIKRCNDNKIECFMLRDVLINHIGTDSLDTKKISSLESNAFRHWHWSWSNFYFYKKHFGFIFAIIKFLRPFLSAIIKSNVYLLMNHQKYRIYKARYSGFLNSMLNKKSNHRMKFN